MHKSEISITIRDPEGVQFFGGGVTGVNSFYADFNKPRHTDDMQMDFEKIVCPMCPVPQCQTKRITNNDRTMRLTAEISDPDFNPDELLPGQLPTGHFEPSKLNCQQAGKIYRGHI